MRYPIISSADANTYLSSRRSGGSISVDGLVKWRGDGEDLDESFVDRLREQLVNIRGKFAEGLQNARDSNAFEAQAARAVHVAVPSDAHMVADPEFWIWLAVARLSETVEWRYGNPEGGTPLANYGVGGRNENLLYRLWLRAELVLDETSKDHYHLCSTGQIDFYRSHLFRQGYANARNFARALLRFQYPHADPGAPKLKLGQIRELVKRLRRLRSNLFLEILEEDDCRKVIETEAAAVQAMAETT